MKSSISALVTAQNYRARRLNIKGVLTTKDIKILKITQNNKCNNDKCSNDAEEIDHIIPLAKGGTNWPHNIQLLCMICNRAKSVKMPNELDAIEKLKAQIAINQSIQAKEGVAALEHWLGNLGGAEYGVITLEMERRWRTMAGVTSAGTM